MKTRLQELDEHTQEYLAPPPDRVVDQKILGLVSDYMIPKIPKGNLLELGVGDQMWTPKLVKCFESVTTLDGSSKLLGKMGETLSKSGLRNRWHPVTTLFEDYTPENRFDVVLATYILEHVDDPQLIVGLAKARWLKPGGTIVIVVPHALSLHRRLAVTMGMIGYFGQLGESDRRMEHTHCFTCFEMEKLLVYEGFKLIERGGMMTKSLPNALLVHLTDEQLKGLFDLGTQLPIEYSGAIYFIAQS